MDVKSTSGRQGHHLIPFFPHFLARKFLLHLIRSSDSTSVPCIKGSLESYSYHYQLGHLLTHGIRYHTPHTHTCTTFISSLCLGRRQRKKKKDYSMPLFGFLIVVYFYPLCAIYYAPIWGSEVYHHFQSMGLFLILFHPSSSDSTCSTMISSK